MALYVFSDAHLGAGTSAEEARKVANISTLFDRVRADGDRLIILGDLYDFWFEYKHAIPKVDPTVLLGIRDLVDRGITVDYVAGNHDFWISDYFADYLGVTMHRDSFATEYAGQRIFCIHGDGLARSDWGYRILKRILRNRLNIWLYRKLPVDWAIPLAKAVSATSRKHTGERDHIWAGEYRDWAKAKLHEGYDLVLIGHLHAADRVDFDHGTYINTGEFMGGFNYVRIDNQDVVLNKLP